jgi:4-hydroxymandelate oxidase
VAAVDNRIDVLIDGGIRRGTDVIKALALGAKAVAVGRPILWGLAYDGQRGVEKVLDILRFEVDLALGLSGFASLAELSPDIIG